MSKNAPRLNIYATDRPADWQPDPLPVLDPSLPVYLDAETDGVDWHKGAKAVGWAWQQGTRKGYAPYRHEGGGNLPEGRVVEWLHDLRDFDVRNAWTKFDAHVALNDGVEFSRLHDIMHAEALLDDWLRDFSLEGAGQRYLGLGKLDPGPKDELGRLPAWDVAAYAVRDVELVARIDALQRPKLTEQDLDGLMQLEDDVLVATVAMEHGGVPIDVSLLDAWLTETEARVEREQWQLSRDLGFAFSDSPACWARLFKHEGLTNPHRTPTGQPSFQTAYLETVQNATVQRALGFMKLGDLRAKFLVPYSQLLWNGRLWPTFHQLMVGDEGTISGRYSCVRPNVQQVMNASKFAKFRDRYGLDYNIRRLFVPLADHVWFSADQSQVEYRLAAHFAYLCRHLFGDAARANAEHLFAQYLANPKTDYHKIVGAMVEPFRPGLTRTEIKITNFRKIYGGGTASTAVALAISDDEAAELLGQYDRAFPCIKELLYTAKRQAEDVGYVKTIAGRRARFPTMQRTYKALNAVIQGSAADDFKRAVVALYRERKRLGYLPHLVVHDENGGSQHKDADAGALATFLNEQRSGTSIPILWEAGVGKNWAEAKSA